MRDDKCFIEVVFGEVLDLLDELLRVTERELTILFDLTASWAAIIIYSSVVQVLQQDLHMFKVVSVMCTNRRGFDMCGDRDIGAVIHGFNQVITLDKGVHEILDNGV